MNSSEAQLFEMPYNLFWQGGDMQIFTRPYLKALGFWSSVCAVMFVSHLFTGMYIFYWLGLTSGFFSLLTSALMVIVGVSNREVVAPKENFVVHLLAWVTISFLFMRPDPNLGISDTVAQFGVFQVTTGQTSFIGLLAAFLVFIAMVRRARTSKKLQVKFTVMDSIGEITTWKDGAGRMKILSFWEPWWKSRPKKDWQAFSSDALTAGDHVKVIGADENLGKLEVAKIDAESERLMADAENTGFSIRLWHWMVVAIAILLLSVVVPNDFLSYFLIYASLVTVGCGAGCSYSKIKGWTWKRQLALWFVALLAVFGFALYSHLFFL